MSKKAILGIIVLIAFILAPLGIRNIVDTTIKSQKLELNDKGILLSIDNTQGYLNSVRDFTLTITNEVKFKEYLTDILLEKYPVYEVFINNFRKSDSKKFDEFLKGIVFKGNIKSSNINPSSDIEVYTYLDKFSDEIMSKIKEDKESSKFILSFLEEESLALTILFDNEVKVKTLSLKDIDENIKTTSKSGKEVKGKFEILGHKLINNSNDKAIIADLKLDKINISINAKNNVVFLIKDIEYNMNYENQFINNGELGIKNINIKINDNRSLQLKETKLLSSGLVSNEVYSVNSRISTSDFKLSDFKLKNKSIETSLDNLDIDVYLNNLDYENIERLNNAYQVFYATSINTRTSKDARTQMDATNKQIVSELTTLVNNGLSLRIDTSLRGLKNKKIDLNSLDLKVDAKLDKNDLSINTFNKFSILNLLNLKAKLEILEDDYKNFSSIIHPNMAQIVSLYALEKNDKVVFELDIKKGKIEVNGKKVN
ncbi:DUF945 family protein [Poseidonibacter ostreae]|jgi:hypothetical protein|uniref:DUF945 family protein n=3 Tax=Poseidonibacter ostreae TaxID=2654171 RepID=A0ABQ6VL80_9BACT|nr:DUF945 family protein [Poseidonibacter ostreae]KAB7885074.1 DUF945 family protein [Poseidonibacter ostreae]KAB7891134.1 DUF945 family protein [Poseidonibacter ostreae]